MYICDRHSACSDSGVEWNNDVRQAVFIGVETLGRSECFQSAFMVYMN